MQVPDSIVRFLLAVLLLLAVSACRNEQPPARKGKTYAVRGEIVRLEPANRIAVIKHEKIGDWMEAMTMEFVVKDPNGFQNLHVGDRIEATLYVNDLEFYITSIRITGKAAS